MIDDAKLAEWRRLCEADGLWAAPWRARTFEVDCPCPNGDGCGDSHTCEEVEAPEEYPNGSPGSPADDGDGQCVVQISVPGLETFAKPTAAFVAASREAVPALLAALDAERAARVADAAHIASIRKNWNDACAENIHLRLARAGAEEAARLATERAAKAETERDEARAALAAGLAECERLRALVVALRAVNRAEDTADETWGALQDASTQSRDERLGYDADRYEAAAAEAWRTHRETLDALRAARAALAALEGGERE